MKKKVLALAALFVATFTLSSCESCGREKTTEEKVEEAAEAVVDDVEQAFEDAGDALEAVGDSIEQATDEVVKELEQ